MTSAINHQELEDELATYQELNKNLVLKLEFKETEIQELKEVIDDLNEENTEKDAAIAKASKIIETFRNELERAKNDIESLEIDKEKLMRENKLIEKELISIQKENHNLDVLKKTETRAKNLNFKLKDEIELINQEFERKEADLRAAIQELEDGRKRAELRIEAYAVETNDIREQLFLKSQESVTLNERIIKLEQTNQQLLEEIQFYKQDKETQEENFSKELRMIKKEAENNIKYYKNLHIDMLANKENDYNSTNRNFGNDSYMTGFDDAPLTSDPNRIRLLESTKRNKFTKTQTKIYDINVKKKAETIRTKRATSSPKTQRTEEKVFVELKQEPNNKITAEYLKITVNEALEREKMLVEYIEKVIGKATEKMLAFSKDVMSKDLILRPEIERWMMRNEELEQRLFDYACKIHVLQLGFNDCKAALQISQNQREIEREQNENLVQELESMINFLQIEIEDKNRLLLNQIPNYEKVIIKSSEDSQAVVKDLSEKLRDLHKDFYLCKKENEILCYRFDETSKKYQEIFGYYKILRNNFLDLEHILAFTFNTTHDETLNLEEYSLPIGYEAIAQRIKSLLDAEMNLRNLEETFAEENDRWTKEIKVLDNHVRTLLKEKAEFEHERGQIIEQITSLETSLQDISKKLHDANHMNQNLQLRNQDLESSNSRLSKQLEQTYENISSRDRKIDQINQELSHVREELEISRVKYNSVEKELTDKEKENAKIMQQIVTYETEQSQTKKQFESMKKELENSKDNFESLNNTNKILEQTLQYSKQEKQSLQENLEASLANVRQLKQEVNSLNISVVHKDSTINMLENQLKESKLSEESIRNEYSVFRVQMTSENLTLQKEVDVSKKQISSFKKSERRRSRSPIHDEDESLPEFAEPHSRMKELYSKSKNSRAVSLGYSSFSKYNSPAEEYLVQFEYFIDSILDKDFKLEEEEFKPDAKIEALTADNVKLADMDRSLKVKLNHLCQRANQIRENWVRTTKSIGAIIVDKLCVSSDQRQIFEDNFMRMNEMKESQISQTCQDIVSLIHYSYSSPKSKSKSDKTFSTGRRDLNSKFSQISRIISNYAHARSEKSLLIKNMILSLRSHPLLSKRGGGYSSRRKNTSPIEFIEEMLTMMSKFSATESEVLNEISQNMADLNLINPQKIDSIEDIASEFLSSETQSFGTLQAMIEKLEDEDQKPGSNSFTYREMKNAKFSDAVLLMKELFEYISEVLSIYYKYSTKHDDKYKKTAVYAEDPQKVMIGLSENVKMISEKFNEEVQNEYVKYLDMKTTKDNSDLNKALFNQNVKLLAVNKLEDELMSFTKTLKLLDIGLIIQKMSSKDVRDFNIDYTKEEPQEIDFAIYHEKVRAKKNEMTQKIEEVMAKMPSVLKHADVINFEQKTTENPHDPKQLYDLLGHPSSSQKVHLNKGQMQTQLYEIMREQAGSRLAFNILMYVYYKYKVIVKDFYRDSL